MRKISVVLMAMVMMLSLGCAKMGTGSAIGGAIGGVAGGLVTALVPDAGPIVHTILPVGGTALGAGAGYFFFDKPAAEEAALEQSRLQAQQQQQAQQQAQQQQLAQLQQTTRLSVPAVVMNGGNQGIAVVNGQQLANILFQVQPGATISMITAPKNVKALTADMSGNGYLQQGSPTKNGRYMMLKFAKSTNRMQMMPLDQALRAL